MNFYIKISNIGKRENWTRTLKCQMCKPWFNAETSNDDDFRWEKEWCKWMEDYLYGLVFSSWKQIYVVSQLINRRKKG